ncbi:MAG: hypothetical protein V2I43_01010 [Parvularcula sp.]|jgi:hypothetical protein|nr:hypothetical protein [Parvularcula sp.]
MSPEEYRNAEQACQEDWQALCREMIGKDTTTQDRMRAGFVQKHTKRGLSTRSLLRAVAVATMPPAATAPDQAHTPDDDALLAKFKAATPREQAKMLQQEGVGDKLLAMTRRDNSRSTQSAPLAQPEASDKPVQKAAPEAPRIKRLRSINSEPPKTLAEANEDLKALDLPKESTLAKARQALRAAIDSEL